MAARDLKLTAVLVDKVSSGLAKAGQDWKKALEEPAKALIKEQEKAGLKIAKETQSRQAKEILELQKHLRSKEREEERYFKYQLNLVKQSSALQDRNEAQRARASMRASHNALNEATDAATAAAKINRQAMLAEAALVVDRFDRRASIEKTRHAEAVRLLKGNNAAIEAETRKHNAIIARIAMDKGNFPNTPFQQLLGHLNKVTSMMGVQLPQAVNTASNSMSGASAVSGRMALGFAAAGASVLALGAGLKFAYGEARESADADKKLDLVLRSTGRGAEFTTEELSKLAGQYQETTDFSDEAVKSAETILLRYDAIGKDVFPKALKAAADLGAETGDLAGAAFNLGSALQMPEEGGKKLTAMGIKLTDTEKSMLQQFADTGETIKAQEFILDKVAKAYGGNAQTMSHETTKLGHAIGEIAEQMGGPLVGSIDLASKLMRSFITTMKSNDSKQYEAVWEDTAEGFMLVSKEVKKANDEMKANNSLWEDAKQQRSGGMMSSMPTPPKPPKAKTDDQIRAEKEASIELANYKDVVAKNESDRYVKMEKTKKAFEEAQTQADFERIVSTENEKTKIKLEGEKQRQQQLSASKAATVQTEQTSAAGNPLALLAIQQREELALVEGNEIAITELKRRHEMERRALTLMTSQATAAGVAGNLAKVAGQYKSFSGVAKKAAQVQNAMDTYAGATAAYKSAAGIPYVGFLMAPIAAAAAIAGGLANASKINSTGFEQGGWTGNGGRTDIAGVVHGGEMVWSQSDVRRAGGRQAAENIRQGNYSSSISAPININLHGSANREDARRVAVAVGAELKALRINERDAAWMGYRA